jgi:hypothetical protein
MPGMAKVTIENDTVAIDLSLLDRLLAFHGSLKIPLAHITNAYVSTFGDLELRFKLLGTGLGVIKEAGIFTNPSGLIFCDVTGGKDSLVLETRGERFPMIAVTLDDGVDPNAVAHQIMAALPDSGPSA